jgi:hypothetical protein
MLAITDVKTFTAGSVGSDVRCNKKGREIKIFNFPTCVIENFPLTRFIRHRTMLNLIHPTHTHDVGKEL